MQRIAIEKKPGASKPETPMPQRLLKDYEVEAQHAIGV